MDMIGQFRQAWAGSIRACRGRALVIASILFLGGCASKAIGPPREGFVAVPGGRVWYQVIGSGQRAPLILLHGGPGGRSCGLTVLRDLGRDRPLVLYDQLGSGRSDRPSDPTLWRTERFVEELAALRNALGLRRVHILGHSWGATLAAEYLLTKKPQGVLSVILSSPLVSTRQWLEDARRLRATLPEDVQRTLERCEEAATADDRACTEAVDLYNRRFVYGGEELPPLPECEGSTPNDEIYRQMWGATEFTATGVLRGHDRTDRIGELRLPVLFVVGRHDEAVPETIEEYRRQIPGARMVVLENSAHLHYRTETAKFLQTVKEFLDEVERQ